MEKVIYYKLDILQMRAAEEIAASLKEAGFDVEVSWSVVSKELKIASEYPMDNDTLIKIGVIIGQISTLKLAE